MSITEEDTAPQLPDTESIVRQAIDSVLDKTSTVAAPSGLDETKVQPWAEKAAPAGKNKRPLEALLAEFAGRIAAAPGAAAGSPTDKRPAESFFERLTRRDGSGGRPARGRRRRSRSTQAQVPQPAAPPRQRPPQQAPQADRPANSGSSSRRRRGRRRRR